MICDTLEQLSLYQGFHKNLDTAIEFLAAHPGYPAAGPYRSGRREVFINVMDADLQTHGAVPTPNTTASMLICRST